MVNSILEFINQIFKGFLNYLSTREKPLLYYEISFGLLYIIVFLAFIWKHLFEIFILLMFVGLIIILCRAFKDSLDDVTIQNERTDPVTSQIEQTNNDNTSSQERFLKIQPLEFDFSKKGKKRVIRSRNWKFVSVQSDGTLIANCTKAEECTEFEILNVEDKYTIKASNNKYLRARLDGSLKAESTTVGDDEKFEIYTINHKTFIKSSYNMFLSTEPSGKIVANRKKALGWEKFYISEKGKKYLLKSSSNKYLNVKTDGTLKIDIMSPDQNAEFGITQIGLYFIIKSWEDKYLSSSYFDLVANRTEAREWEYFQISKQDNKYIISYKDKVISTTQDDKLILTSNLVLAEKWEIIQI